MESAGPDHELLTRPAAGGEVFFGRSPVSAGAPSVLKTAVEPAVVLSAYGSDEPYFDERRLGVDRVGRLLDLTIAITMLIFLLPVMLVLGALIVAIDPGPVIFAHKRVGRAGRMFNCYKFRTMYVGAEARLEAILAVNPVLREEWARTQKLAEDPRITWLGSWLRMMSLDELPQLFNVIAGDMSLVGPRPIVRNEIGRYGRHIQCYYRVRPGLTGLWQVTRDDATSYRRRVAADVLYDRRKSLKFDLKILVATIPAVLLGRGLC